MLGLKWGQTSRNRFILSGGEKLAFSLRSGRPVLGLIAAACWRGSNSLLLPAMESNFTVPNPGASHRRGGTWLACGKGDISCHLPFWPGKPQRILPWSALACLRGRELWERERGGMLNWISFGWRRRLDLVKTRNRRFLGIFKTEDGWTPALSTPTSVLDV